MFEMNTITRDVLFAKVKEIELIRLQNTNILNENIEKCENKISRILSANELLQIVKNKLVFLGVDLSGISLSLVKTPVEFSRFLTEINKYHKGF